MRWSGLYLNGLGSYVPDRRETAAEAISAHRYTEEERARTQQRSASVASPERGETPAAMAVAAGRRALASGGIEPAEVDLLVHAVTLHNGLEIWNCAAYLQDQLGIEECLPVEIRTACTGVVVGLEMVGRWFGGRGCGLVTAADAWSLPLFDRWGSDSGLVYGDAGAAVVVGPRPGPFQMLSTALVSDPGLEKMHRGNETTDMPQYRRSGPIDLRGRGAAFRAERPIEEFWARNAAGLSRAAQTALSDAGVHRDDVRTWLLPHFGEELLRRQCHEPLKITSEQTVTDTGHDIGHTGAADPLLGLDHLRATSALAPSDVVVLVGVGGGFTWGCAVLRATALVSDVAA